MTPRDPVADLRRIAFLLERANEATYRVRAFRSAATTIAALPAGELAERVAAGTLSKLAGVGDVTARTVAESMAGEVPAYLRRLEATEGTQLPEAAAALRQALRGDCHLHSDWSDGGSPIEEMALAAVELGHEYMVLTDHSPRLTVARGLPPARLRRQLDHVARLNEQLPEGFRILTGIEVDILEDGSLDQEDALLERLDVVVGSVHSKLRDESARMTRRMITAIANPHLDILGHMTGRKVSATGSGVAAEGDRAWPDPPAQRLRPGQGAGRGGRARQGDRDQLAAGPAGPAEADAHPGAGGRLPVQHRHRRARPGPAGLAAVRLRTGGAVRRAGRAGGEHLAGGAAAGLDRRLGSHRGTRG